MNTDIFSISIDKHMADVNIAKVNIEEQGCNEGTVKALLQYIDNSRWQVRKVVAEAVVFVDSDRIFPFCALLSDTNTYVRKTAQNSFARSNIPEEPNQNVTETLLKRDKIIAKKYGDEVADWVRRETEKAYDMTVGAVAHDIRGLISPMQGSVNSLFKLTQDPLRVQDTAQISRHLQRLQQRIKVLQRLADDIGILAKQTSNCRLQEQVKSIVGVAHEMALESFTSKDRDVSKIRFENYVPEHLTFKVSRFDIVRALHNLIKNAYESFAVKRGVFKDGRISVNAEETPDGKIVLQITDEGIGMSPEDLKYYLRFQPGSTSKKETGTGFGRAIAYRKIRDHNGTLNVESKEDSGTTVTVKIPKNTEMS